MTSGIHAQDSAAALKFEIVSIHPAPPDARGMGISPRGSRVQIRNATLKFLIQVGWNVQDFSISGGPSWLDERRWDIVATPGGEMARIRPMIQNMLVDRFGLVVHRETREARVYDLVVSKPGRLKGSGAWTKPINDRPGLYDWARHWYGTTGGDAIQPLGTSRHR